jgi:hypothetical protein
LPLKKSDPSKLLKIGHFIEGNKNKNTVELKKVSNLSSGRFVIDFTMLLQNN